MSAPAVAPASAPSSSGSRRVAFVVVPVLALAALLAWGVAHSPTSGGGDQLVGTPAPSFTLRALDGHEVSLASLRGRVVVLNFWASWCAACRQEHPALEQVWQRYGGRDVRVLGVLFEDQRDPASAFARRYGATWPTLLDPGSRTAIAYGITGVPETFVVGPDGTILEHAIGPVSAPQVSAWIAAALGGSRA